MTKTNTQQKIILLLADITTLAVDGLVNSDMKTALAYKKAASKLAATDVEILDLMPAID